MSNRQIIAFAFWGIMMIGILIPIGWLYRKNHPDIHVGQVWVKEYYKNDPYRKTERDTIIILDVKDNYALYKRGNDTTSERCYWIPINARLLSDTKK